METGDTIWVKGCFIEPLDIPLHSAGAGNISVKRPSNEWNKIFYSGKSSDEGRRKLNFENLFPSGISSLIGFEVIKQQLN